MLISYQLTYELLVNLLVSLANIDKGTKFVVYSINNLKNIYPIRIILFGQFLQIWGFLILCPPTLSPFENFKESIVSKSMLKSPKYPFFFFILENLLKMLLPNFPNLLYFCLIYFWCEKNIFLSHSYGHIISHFPCSTEHKTRSSCMLISHIPNKTYLPKLHIV